MFLVPQCFEPPLGILRDDCGLEHLGLGDLFPRWLPHSYSGSGLGLLTETPTYDLSMWCGFLRAWWLASESRLQRASDWNSSGKICIASEVTTHRFYRASLIRKALTKVASRIGDIDTTSQGRGFKELVDIF